MNPAMILTFVGFWMVLLDPYLIKEGCSTIKLLVFIMAYVHKFAVMRKGLAPMSVDKYYRIWNEVPTVLMIIIVILVVVKPF